MKDKLYRVINLSLVLVLLAGILPMTNIADEEINELQENTIDAVENSESSNEVESEENNSHEENNSQINKDDINGDVYATPGSDWGGSTLAEWTNTKDDGNKTVVISEYIGSATKINIPTVIEGYKVIIKTTGGSASNLLFPPTITDLTTTIVDGNKITFANNSMYCLFKGTNIVNFDDLSGFDTSQVTDMSSMFWASKATSLHMTEWGWDTSSVTTMYAMFSGLSQCETIEWDNLNLPKLTEIRYLFNGTIATQNILIRNWNFKGNNSNLNINGNVFDNIFHIINQGRTDFTHIDMSGWYFPTGITSIGTLPGSEVSKYHDLILNNWTLPSVVNLDNFFTITTTQQTFTGSFEMNNLNAPQLQSAVGMLKGVANCSFAVKLQNWNCPILTSVANMFDGSTSLSSIDVTGWQTPQLNNTSYMFRNCSVLSDLNGISTLPVDNVTTLESMFYNCDGLSQLDLSNWNVDNVVSATNMFAQADNLTFINLQNATFSSTANLTSMFKLNQVTPLTVVTNDLRLQDNAYNYNADNRKVRGVEFNANGGQFAGGTTTNVVDFKNIAVHSTNVSDIIEPSAFEQGINTHPTKSGCKFIGWSTSTSGPISTPDLSAIIGETQPTFYAQYSNIQIIMPGPDGTLGTGDDVIVDPNPDSSGSYPSKNPNGSVVLPNGGTVTPNNGTGETTVVPDGTIVTPGGSITLPGPGTVTGNDVTLLPNGNGSITVPGPDNNINRPEDNVIVNPSGTNKPTINPDGTIDVPNGGVVNIPAGDVTPPNGSVVYPDGTIVTPNGPVINPDGSVGIPGPNGNLGDQDDVLVPPVGGNIPTVDDQGNTHVPDNGIVETPEGTINVPNGTIVKPDGTIVGPNGEIYNPDGSITLPGPDKKPGTGDDVVVAPNKPGQLTPNPDGSITIPSEGGSVTPDKGTGTPTDEQEHQQTYQVEV